jgi:hypothetical protein
VKSIADKVDQSYTNPALDLHLGFVEQTLTKRPYFAGKRASDKPPPTNGPRPQVASSMPKICSTSNGKQIVENTFGGDAAGQAV